MGRYGRGQAGTDFAVDWLGAGNDLAARLLLLQDEAVGALLAEFLVFCRQRRDDPVIALAVVFLHLYVVDFFLVDYLRFKRQVRRWQEAGTDLLRLQGLRGGDRRVIGNLSAWLAVRQSLIAIAGRGRRTAPRPGVFELRSLLATEARLTPGRHVGRAPKAILAAGQARRGRGLRLPAWLRHVACS